MVLRPCHDRLSAPARSTLAAAACMRTALGSLQTRLELLLAEEPGALTPAQRGELAAIGREGRRVASLVVDVELVARAEEGRLELDWTPCDLAALAHRAVEMVWPRAFPARKQIDLRVPGPVLALADEPRLSDALLRLARLAVDATPEGGTVAIEVTKDAVELRYEAPAGPVPADLAVAVADAVARAHGGALAVAADAGAVTLSLSLGAPAPAAADATALRFPSAA
jgi:signal transduction histidine kinase